MVCGSIFAYQSGAVETYNDGKFQYCHVVNDVVVGALCERTVYVAERQHAFLCHSCRECDGVAFGNAHVEGSVGHRLHQYVHGASCRHCRRYAYYARIVLCQFEQRLAEHCLIFRRHSSLVVCYALACVDVEFSGGMPYRCSLFGRCISVPLYCVQVQQLGAFHVL